MVNKLQFNLAATLVTSKLSESFTTKSFGIHASIQNRKVKAVKRGKLTKKRKNGRKTSPRFFPVKKISRSRFGISVTENFCGNKTRFVLSEESESPNGTDTIFKHGNALCGSYYKMTMVVITSNIRTAII